MKIRNEIFTDKKWKIFLHNGALQILHVGIYGVGVTRRFEPDPGAQIETQVPIGSYTKSPELHS